MAVVIPNTKDEETFPDHFIPVANPPQRPISSSEQSWIDKSPSFYTPTNTGETEDIGFSGDVPEYTHLAPTVKASDTEVQEISTELQNIDPATLDTAWGKLEAVLNQELAKASSGHWRELSSNYNPDSIGLCQSLCGHGAGVPWCACFVSWALVKAGINGLKTASSQKYRGFGFEIGTNNWANVRKNDIVVVTYGGGRGHVGFYRGFDPKTRRVNILGGNQGDNLNIKSFGTSRITSIKRNWRIPADFDTPLYVPRAPRGGSFEDTR